LAGSGGLLEIKNMEDKELKKQLKKIPDVDKNGDPIYKIDDGRKSSGDKSSDASNNSKKATKNKIGFK